MNEIDIYQALEMDDAVIVDVRSPGEYEEDHIPGAVSIPLFDDEERALIGTMYKQIGKETAVEKGISITTPKLDEFYKKFSELSLKYTNIIIYCYRGGMRSQSLTNFIVSCGIKACRITGGYKAYRKYVIDYLENIPEDFKFVVLHGHTGTGKTQILTELQKKGICCIDLEYLAKNSGSVYGEIFYQGHPPTQKTFESLIVDIMKNCSSKHIFMESESKKIGKVIIPKSFWNFMLEGDHILVESSLESRVKRIVDDYTKNELHDDEYLKRSTKKLQDTLGASKISMLIDKIDEKDYEYVARYLIENYYDALYGFSIKKYEYVLTVNSDLIDQSVEDIQKLY